MRTTLKTVALFAFAVSTATAQNGGTLSGSVASSTGIALSSARVAIVTPATVALTDAAGKYTMRDLQPGHYDVIVTAIGYKPSRSSVDITKGQTTTFDAKLEVGSILLPGIVTSANRLPTEATHVAATINTLEPAAIRASPAREAQDLLREIPSVELPRTSSIVSGNAQIVSIRGVDEGRTAVLFDGIPVSDAWGEWIDWSRVPNMMLDRVEVVEGGSSSLYGNGAMGGLIQFFSRPMAPRSMTMQLDGGTAGARHAYVGAGIPLMGAFSAQVNGDYGEGGGYTLIDSTGAGCPQPATATSRCLQGAIDTPNTSIRRNIYTRLNYNPSANLSAFITGHKFSDNRQVGTPLSRQSRDQKNFDLGLNYGAFANGLLNVRAYNGEQDEFQRSTAVRAAATAANATAACPVGIARACEDSSVAVLIPSHDYGASAQWSRTGWMHLESFSVGADYRHMQGNFDEVDFNTTCPGANCGKFVRHIWSGGDQVLSGAFAQAVYAPLNPLRIELSARVDRWTNDNAQSVDSASTATGSTVVNYQDRNKNAFSPRLGARYQLLSNLSVHGAVYKAFRAPNLAELYRKQISGATGNSVTLPNPNLSAENALGREIGFDFTPVEQIQLKGTYYVAEYDSLNVPVTLNSVASPTSPCGPVVTTCRQRQNITGVRSEGIEASIGIRPISQLFILGSVNYDDARQQTGLAAASTPDTVHKPHVNRVPSPKQAVKATYTDRMFGTWTGIWRHEGHTTTLQGVVLNPYSTFDASVQRELRYGLTGFLAAENLGDTKYQVNLSGPGTTSALVSDGTPRTIRVGVIVDR